MAEEKTVKTSKMKRYKIREGVDAKIIVGGQHLGQKKGREIPEAEAELIKKEYGDILVEAKKPDGETEGRILTEAQKAHMAKLKKQEEVNKKAEEKIAEREARKSATLKKAKMSKKPKAEPKK